MYSNTQLKFLTPRCQINESTRLSFLDFPPPCIWTCHILFPTLLVYMALLILLFHPTPLFGPIFYEIYIEYPPYSFIWPYSFNWHPRVSNWNNLGVLQLFLTSNLFESKKMYWFVLNHFKWHLLSFYIYIPYESLILGQLLDLISLGRINLFEPRFESYDPWIANFKYFLIILKIEIVF